LDTAGICVSTGSACNAESREVSGVLKAMGTPYETARGAIRFSLGRYNTEAEIDATLAALSEIIES
jgi:cysteine desulfurase